MTEPLTEAGRDVVSKLAFFNDDDMEWWRERVLAIEREARTPEAAKWREALTRYDLHCESFNGKGYKSRSEYDLCIKHGRRVDAEYADDQACWPCMIRALLAALRDSTPTP